MGGGSFNIGTEEAPIPNTPTARVCPFDSGGLSYSVIAETGNVTVTGRAEGNESTEIVIPGTVDRNGITYNVTAVGQYAFASNSLTSVTIGDSVTTIGSFAFAFNALTSVTIPESMTTIGSFAFVGNALTIVTMPDSVETIGEGAFAFNALTSVTIPDSMETIGEGAFAHNALTSVTIPESMTTIGSFAFVGNALTSVTIPDSVETIGSAAFAGNALTSVTIPGSVTTIEGYAFAGNTLTSLAFEGDFGTFNLNMFDDNPTLATITFCDDTENWGDRFNIGTEEAPILNTPAARVCITGNLDLDGNGRYDALTDGLLMLRGMFELTGDALIAGAIADDATYTTAEEIQSRITALGDQVDIDGNGNIDALTDGLLVLRYLFDLSGENMVAGVVAEGATRASALQIEGYIETLMPPLP